MASVGAARTRDSLLSCCRNGAGLIVGGFSPGIHDFIATVQVSILVMYYKDTDLLDAGPVYVCTVTAGRTASTL